MTLFRLFASLLLASRLASATDAKFEGQVVSETNAPIPNARVFLVCGATRLQALSGADGVFAFPAAPAPPCFVSVEAPGFFPLRNKRVEPGELRLILNPLRELTETVDVQAVPRAVDLDTTSTEQSLTGADILNVPYPATNNLPSAMRILPGVIPGSKGELHVNGGAPEQTYYTLDGFNLGDPLSGRFETRLSVEAVQSVEVVSGPMSAQNGKGSAGTLSIRTRSGDDKFRASATNFFPGFENRKGIIIGDFTPRLNFSGPFRRGRAWWSNSSDLVYSQLVVPEINTGRDRSWTAQVSNLLHTQFNLTPSSILYINSLVTGWNAPRWGLTALDPEETTVDRRTRQVFNNIRNQRYFGRGALIDFGYANNQVWGREIPQGLEPMLFTAAGRRGNWWRDSRQRSSRHQFLGSAFLPTFQWKGSHLFKLGLDVNYLSYDQQVRRTGFTNLRRDGHPLRRTTFLGDGMLDRNNTEAALFVQDSWRPKPNLQIEAGLRWDWDQIIRRHNFAPRAGFAWSPARRESTKFSGGFGSVFDATNLQLFIRPDDQAPLSTYFGATGEVLRGPAITLFRRADQRIRSAGFSTYSFGWEERFAGVWSAKVNYLGKRGLRGLTYVNKFEPGDRNPLPEFPIDAFFQLVNERQDRYDSVEFTLRQALKRQYEWMVSYIRSSARSNSSVDLSIDEPQIVPDNSGPLPWDSPHRFVSWGYLPTFWQSWSLAYLVEYRTGFPYSVIGEDGRVQGRVNAQRLPYFLEANLHAEWKISAFGQRWALRGGFNNLTARRNAVTINNVAGSPQFLTTYGGFGRAANFRIRWLGRR